LNYLRKKIEKDYRQKGETPRLLFKTLDNIKEDALVIGFARRFATYKRAGLLFRDIERLTEMVCDKDRPILLVFAGKAHPADEGGQALIKEIVRISKEDKFAGKIIFLENYNMEMAKLLVQGVDLWLNTPTRPKEASGTSGMKAILNGVLNFSVLDGWWAEGYQEGAGWALPQERTYEDQNLQNELDTQLLFSMLENEIIPTYFKVDEETGIPADWLANIRKSIAEVAPNFCMQRMLGDYYTKFYNTLISRTESFTANQFENLKKYVAWKKQALVTWSGIEVLEKESPGVDNFTLEEGHAFNARLKINTNGYHVDDIQAEAVFYEREQDGFIKLEHIHPMEVKSVQDNIVEYSCNFLPALSGVFEFGFRLLPKGEFLSHKQAIDLIKWV